MSAAQDDFRINWETFRNSAEERAGWLRRETAIIEEWREKAGPFGRKLTEEFATTGAAEEINMGLTEMSGSYNPYAIRPSKFKNGVHLGPRALASRVDLYNIKNHENFHAIQAMTSAAFHARPNNANTSIILCPTHIAWLDELCEVDAYGKGGMMEGLLAKAGIEKNAPAQEVTLGRIFNLVRQRKPDELSYALLATGLATMGTAKDTYNYNSLDYYARALELRKNDRLTFVRMDEEDVLAIGNTLGVNTFVYQGKIAPPFRQPPELCPSNLLSLIGYGIGNEKDMPTLGEALADLGLTKRQFLQTSRAAPASFSTI